MACYLLYIGRTSLRMEGNNLLKKKKKMISQSQSKLRDEENVSLGSRRMIELGLCMSGIEM